MPLATHVTRFRCLLVNSSESQTLRLSRFVSPWSINSANADNWSLRSQTCPASTLDTQLTRTSNDSLELTTPVAPAKKDSRIISSVAELNRTTLFNVGHARCADRNMSSAR